MAKITVEGLAVAPKCCDLNNNAPRSYPIPLSLLRQGEPLVSEAAAIKRPKLTGSTIGCEAWVLKLGLLLEVDAPKSPLRPHS